MMGAATVLKMNTARADRVRTEWKVVTPEMATKWLEGNTHNRTVRDSVVQRYAADMKAGRWKQSHQGIAFDEEGTLIDGQHRLYAIIYAETGVLIQVTYGLPIETQRVIDDGLKRSVVDILRVQDESMGGMSALHAAVGHRMWMGLTSPGNRGNTVRTRQEVGAFIVKHWEAINFAVALFPGAKRVKGVTSAGPIAALARAFYHEDRADIERFARVMSDGMSEEAKDFVAVKLRNYLLTRKQAAGGVAVIDAYAKTQRALHAFTHNQTVGRNLLPVTEDLYPLPINGRK